MRWIFVRNAVNLVVNFCKKCGEKRWIIFFHRIHRNHRISYENSPHSSHFLRKFTKKPRPGIVESQALGSSTHNWLLKRYLCIFLSDICEMNHKFTFLALDPVAAQKSDTEITYFKFGNSPHLAWKWVTKIFSKFLHYEKQALCYLRARLSNFEAIWNQTNLVSLH